MSSQAGRHKTQASIQNRNTHQDTCQKSGINHKERNSCKQLMHAKFQKLPARYKG